MSQHVLAQIVVFSYLLNVYVVSTYSLLFLIFQSYALLINKLEANPIGIL